MWSILYNNIKQPYTMRITADDGKVFMSELFLKEFVIQ